MMGAASLPNPQASIPAGFAAFLSTIGQTPTGSGEDGEGRWRNEGHLHDGLRTHLKAGGQIG